MEGRFRKGSKLWNLSALEQKTEFEMKLENLHGYLTDRVGKLSETERIETISHMVNHEQKHDDVSLGLLYGILTEKPKASQYYRDLVHFTTDGWNNTLTNVNFILVECFQKLKDSVKEALIWFLNESIRTGVPNMDNVLNHALRNIKAGDMSVQNMRLIDQILNVLQEQSEWLKALKLKNPFINNLVCIFLRVILDLSNPSTEPLRKKISKFLVWLIREKFQDCVLIGRDFVRLLIMAARIPGIDSIWNDIKNNPTTLAPNFNGVQDILNTKTSKRLLVNRVPVSMEREIFFIIRELKLGKHERHWDWFSKKYFMSHDSLSVRTELIRYVLCVVSEGDKLLPDSIRRWHVLSWILASSLNVTESQLHEFLPEFAHKTHHPPPPPHSPSLVVNTIDGEKPLSSESISTPDILLDPLTMDTTASFSDEDSEDTQGAIDLVDVMTRSQKKKSVERVIEEKEEVGLTVQSINPPTTIPLSSSQPPREQSPTGTDTTYSDDGEEEEDDPEKDEKEVSDSMEMLEEQMKDLVETLREVPSEDDEGRCNAMQQLLVAVLQDEDDFDEKAEYLAKCLAKGIFRSHFRKKKILPSGSDSSDESAISESLSSPFFSLFRNLCMTPEGDPSCNPLVALLGEMRRIQPRVGYQFLYFLTSFRDADDRLSPYKKFCEYYTERTDLKSPLENGLVSDMKHCQLDDYKLFGYLIPFIYSTFKQEAMSSSSLMHLIVGTIDSQQLYDIIGKVLHENVVLFKRDSFSEILKGSLDWETIEQYFFWKLVEAEDVPVEWMHSIIPKLSYPIHTEAMSAVLLCVRRQEKDPSTKTLVQFFNREPYKKNDLFVVNALKIFIDYWPEKTADIIAKFIAKKNELSSKKSKMSSSTPSVENVLGHLDRYRQEVMSMTDSLHMDSLSSDFFLREELREALHKVKKGSDGMKEKFQELFAMVEVLAAMVKGHDVRSLRRGRTGNPSLPLTSAGHETSEDEGPKKTPRKKKPKVESDSD